MKSLRTVSRVSPEVSQKGFCEHLVLSGLGGRGPRGLEDRSSVLRTLWLVASDMALPQGWVSSTWWAFGLAPSGPLISASCLAPPCAQAVGSVFTLHSRYCCPSVSQTWCLQGRECARLRAKLWDHTLSDQGAQPARRHVASDPPRACL